MPFGDEGYDDNWNFKWKCLRCNFVFEGDEPPERCPKCKHKTEFNLMENYYTGVFEETAKD